MAQKKAPHCPHCAHFAINYTRPMPLTCRLWGIGTQMGKMPSHAIFETTQQHCRYFQEKNRKRAFPDNGKLKRPEPDADIDFRV